MKLMIMFAGQSLPSSLFDVVETANTITPKMASFTVVLIRNKTAKFYIFGKHFIKFKKDPSKTKLMMRPLYNTEFHYL